MIEIVDQIDAYDPFASEIMSTQLRNILSMQSIITHVDGRDEFRFIYIINSKRQDSIIPEEPISRLCIRLKTTAFTLKDTIHKYICTTGFLTKRFHIATSYL